MTPSELAALEALVVAEKARQTGLQLPDNRRADNAALGEETPMCEIHGPYRDRKKFRVRIIDTMTGKQSSRIFTTETEALAAIPVLQAQYRRPIGLPLPEALDAYEVKLRARQRKPSSRTAETALGRIRAVVGDTSTITGDIGVDDARKLWDAYATRSTHSKRPPSTDSQIGTLKALRALWVFLVERGWAKVDPFAGIKVEGQRHRGKPQLGKDHARALKALALDRAQKGDEGALAALLALYLGLRASEVVDRLVADIDDGGKELVVTEAKTSAGDRRLMLPDVLVPLVARLTEGRGPSERLFPGRNRHWVYREVAQLVADAGIKRVTPHGLRGTASSLAQSSGMIGSAVAASLGHESYETTRRHYTDPSAPANAQIQRVANALN